MKTNSFFTYRISSRISPPFLGKYLKTGSIFNKKVFFQKIGWKSKPWAYFEETRYFI
jgi:hypothetical protein